MRWLVLGQLGDSDLLRAVSPDGVRELLAPCRVKKLRRARSCEICGAEIVAGSICYRPLGNGTFRAARFHLDCAWPEAERGPGRT